MVGHDRCYQKLIRCTLKEYEYLTSCVLVSNLPLIDLIMNVMTKVMPVNDERLFLKQSQKALEAQVKRFLHYAKLHHQTFVEAMDLTVKKIHPQTIIEYLIEPTIKILQAENDCKEGVTALNNLKDGLTNDYERFERYSRDIMPVSYTHLTLPTILLV